MKVFLTGATGYIGRTIAERLRCGGHAVRGLARSDASAMKLKATGVGVVRGGLRDLPILEAAARDADGVIHAGAEWSNEMGTVDRAAVAAMVGALAGSLKPFLYTSGSWVLGDTGGEIVRDDAPLNPPPFVAWRPGVEELVANAGTRAVRGVVIRPTMVYGRAGGILADFVRQARDQGKVRHVGSGENHWSFVHVEDLARLYVLALETGDASGVYMVSGGTSLSVRGVAAAAARLAGASATAEAWPIDEARQELGPMAEPLTMDQRIVVTRARDSLGWSPAAPGVLEELSPDGCYG